MEYCKRERRVVISIRLSVCGSFCVKCASKALLLMCLVQSSLGFGSVYSHSLLFDLLHSQYRHIFTWFSQFVPSRNPRRSFVFLDSRCSSRNPSLQSQTRAYTKNIQWTLWSTPDVSLFLGSSFLCLIFSCLELVLFFCAPLQFRRLCRLPSEVKRKNTSEMGLAREATSGLTRINGLGF